MKCVIGLDPSLTNTGLVVLDEFGEVFLQRGYKATPKPLVSGRVLRCMQVSGNIEYMLDECGLQPLVVCIEGYSMGSNGANHSHIIELGYELRRMMCGLEWNPRVVEVAPTTLKKFATSGGNGRDKASVSSALTHRYGVRFESEDEADAYGLARMAHVIAGFSEAANEPQREAVTVAMYGAVKKSRKRAAKPAE